MFDPPWTWVLIGVVVIGALALAIWFIIEWFGTDRLYSREPTPVRPTRLRGAAPDDQGFPSRDGDIPHTSWRARSEMSVRNERWPLNESHRPEPRSSGSTDSIAHANANSSPLRNELPPNAILVEKLTSRVEDLEMRVSRLERMIKELTKELRGPAVGAGMIPAYASIEPRIPLAVSTSLYAETPGDGAFPDGSLSADRGPFSLFEIRPRDGFSAVLKLCDNPEAHRRALGNHRVLLLPACEYVDMPDRVHTRISEVRSGSAEKADGCWKVKDKVTVRFS